MKCFTIKKVIDYIDRARTLHPEIADDLLVKDVSDVSTIPYTIYYMNGNDGTDFDFSYNKRTCEFMVFYRASEKGFLKVFVSANDTIRGYCYGDGQMTPFDDGGVLMEESIDEGEAKIFARQLQDIADNKNLFDMPISCLNFDS